jgi:hypothetical protein
MLDEDLNISENITHGKPVDVYFHGDLTAIASAEELVVFDADGNFRLRERLYDVPKSVCMSDNFVFLLRTITQTDTASQLIQKRNRWRFRMTAV